MRWMPQRSTPVESWRSGELAGSPARYGIGIARAGGGVVGSQLAAGGHRSVDAAEKDGGDAPRVSAATNVEGPWIAPEEPNRPPPVRTRQTSSVFGCPRARSSARAPRRQAFSHRASPAAMRDVLIPPRELPQREICGLSRLPRARRAGAAECWPVRVGLRERQASQLRREDVEDVEVKELARPSLRGEPELVGEADACSRAAR